MKALSVFLLLSIVFFISACTKDSNNALTDYIRMQQNGVLTYYTVAKAYWQVIDTGAMKGKNYYITAYQAFTDSLNYVTLQLHDNTTPVNKFCPAQGVYGDLNAPSSGCMDSAKTCTGFTLSYYSTVLSQPYVTTADSISPASQLIVYSCDDAFQQISGTFQGRIILLAGTQPFIKIDSGQFNDVVFSNQQ